MGKPNLNTKKQTCSIMGNCPKFKFSLIIGPSLYWRQTSIVNFPAYEIFACLHCSKTRTKKKINWVNHWLKKPTKLSKLKINKFWNLLQMEVRPLALSWKFAPSEVDIAPDYPTKVWTKLREQTPSPSAMWLQLNSSLQTHFKKNLQLKNNH